MMGFLKELNVSGIVNYETCFINKGEAMNVYRGIFVAKEAGVYDFAATFLMKSDYNDQVTVSLKRGEVNS